MSMAKETKMFVPKWVLHALAVILALATGIPAGLWLEEVTRPKSAAVADCDAAKVPFPAGNVTLELLPKC